MRKLLCAMVVVLALLAVPATSALAAEPEIVQPTAEQSRICKGETCFFSVSVRGLSVAIWGTNGTSIVTVTGPVITVAFDDPIVGFDDPIVGFDDPIVGHPGIEG